MWLALLRLIVLAGMVVVCAIVTLRPYNHQHQPPVPVLATEAQPPRPRGKGPAGPSLVRLIPLPEHRAGEAPGQGVLKRDRASRKAGSIAQQQAVSNSNKQKNKINSEAGYVQLVIHSIATDLNAGQTRKKRQAGSRPNRKSGIQRRLRNDARSESWTKSDPRKSPSTIEFAQYGNTDLDDRTVKTKHIGLGGNDSVEGDYAKYVFTDRQTIGEVGVKKDNPTASSENKKKDIVTVETQTYNIDKTADSMKMGEDRDGVDSITGIDTMGEERGKKGKKTGNLIEREKRSAGNIEADTMIAEKLRVKEADNVKDSVSEESQKNKENNETDAVNMTNTSETGPRSKFAVTTQTAITEKSPAVAMETNTSVTEAPPDSSVDRTGEIFIPTVGIAITAKPIPSTTQQLTKPNFTSSEANSTHLSKSNTTADASHTSENLTFLDLETSSTVLNTVSVSETTNLIHSSASLENNVAVSETPATSSEDETITVEGKTAAPTSEEQTTVSSTSVEQNVVASFSIEQTTFLPTSVEQTTFLPTSVEQTTFLTMSVEQTTISPTLVEGTTVSPTSVKQNVAVPTLVEQTTVPPTSGEQRSVSPTSVEHKTVAPTSREQTNVSLSSLEQNTGAPSSVRQDTAPLSSDQPKNASPTPTKPRFRVFDPERQKKRMREIVALGESLDEYNKERYKSRTENDYIEAIAAAVYQMEDRQHMPDHACDKPQPYVKYVSHPTETHLLVIPRCVLLHRCNKFSGCCMYPYYVCGPQKVDIVTLAFVASTAIELALDMEPRDAFFMSFVNHTQCGCQIQHEPARCYKECPEPFVQELDGVHCICTCYGLKDGAKYNCEQIEHGVRPLSMEGIQCIKDGDCYKPRCIAEEFSVSRGYCPLSDEYALPEFVFKFNKSHHRHYRDHLRQHLGITLPGQRTPPTPPSVKPTPSNGSRELNESTATCGACSTNFSAGQNASGSEPQVESEHAEGVSEQSEEVSEQPEGVSEQSEGVSEQSEGVSEQSEGVSEQSEGVSEQSEGVSEQSEGVSEQSEGVSEQSEGVSEQSEGVSEQSEEVNEPATTPSVPGLQRTITTSNTSHTSSIYRASSGHVNKTSVSSSSNGSSSEQNSSARINTTLVSDNQKDTGAENLSTVASTISSVSDSGKIAGGAGQNLGSSSSPQTTKSTVASSSAPKSSSARLPSDSESFEQPGASTPHRAQLSTSASVTSTSPAREESPTPSTVKDGTYEEVSSVATQSEPEDSSANEPSVMFQHTTELLPYVEESKLEAFYESMRRLQDSYDDDDDEDGDDYEQ